MSKPEKCSKCSGTDMRTLPDAEDPLGVPMERFACNACGSIAIPSDGGTFTGDAFILDGGITHKEAAR